MRHLQPTIHISCLHGERGGVITIPLFNIPKMFLIKIEESLALLAKTALIVTTPGDTKWK